MSEPAPLLRVYLDVTGDFDPQAFGVSVGLEPDRLKRRGEGDAARVIPRCDSWSVGVPERHEWGLERIVAELLLRLEGHEDRIAGAVQARHLSVFLRVVASWDPQTTSSPAVTLSAGQMARLSRLGASLDVDLYPLCSGELDGVSYTDL